MFFWYFGRQLTDSVGQNCIKDTRELPKLPCQLRYSPKQIHNMRGTYSDKSGGADGQLIGTVPAGQLVADTRPETALKETEKGTTSIKRSLVVAGGVASTDDGP